MKKRVILLFVLLFSVLSVLALPENEKKDVGLWHDKSNRGLEFTMKGVVFPLGIWTHDYYSEKSESVAAGAELILSYRFNRCMSFGVGFSFIYGGVGSIPLVNFKFNVYDGGKFMPYVSLSCGFNSWGLVLDSFVESYHIGEDPPKYDRFPETGYPKYSDRWFITLNCAAGLDFPLRKGSLFVELRADYEMPKIIGPGIGFGYTF